MTKSIFTIFALVFTFTCFAGEDKDKKDDSKKGFVRTELTDEKSFDVNGLNACQVEADDEEVAEYVATPAPKVKKSLSLELMTEDIEDGQMSSL